MNAEDRSKLLDLFALGFSIGYCWHNLQAEGKLICYEAIRKFYHKCKEQGLIAERRKTITEELPIADKRVRFHHYQTELERIRRMLDISTPINFDGVEKLIIKLFELVAKETGAIQTGVNAQTHVYTSGNGRPTKQHLRDLMGVLEGRINGSESDVS